MQYTHGHLIKKIATKNCQICGFPTLIKHIMIECRNTQEARQKFNILEYLHDTQNTNEDLINFFFYL